MAGEHILIIDDSKEITSFILALLQPQGYILDYTENGKEGLAKALYDQPDLILLDLNLPGMSGMAILEALHQRQVTIPVILMTLHGSESVVARALRLGVRDYIIKPFQIEEMLAAIERALAEGRLERERAQLASQLKQAQQKLKQQTQAIAHLQTQIKSRGAPAPKAGIPPAAVHVVNLFYRYATASLQALWRTCQNFKDNPRRAPTKTAEREVKRLAALLSILKEAFTPKSALYIGTTSIQDIEKELKNRLGTIK